MSQLRLFALIATLFFPPLASAGTIPLRLEVSDGENPQQVVIDAPLIEWEMGYSFETSGTLASETWELDW